MHDASGVNLVSNEPRFTRLCTSVGGSATRSLRAPGLDVATSRDPR